MTASEFWVAEYSAGQDAFHVQPLETALEGNMQRARGKDRSNDWVLVALGEEAWVRAVIALLLAGQENDPHKEMAAAEVLKQMMKRGPANPNLRLIDGGKA